ncbi:MAG TPA: hypothetical protein PKA63_00670 [Oligoflexia bacterium]|nr:hypothetical protein [Oligoflexia bacterium]HMP47163.1 hypothetical protein [Oligoflexia bacterium]
MIIGNPIAESANEKAESREGLLKLFPILAHELYRLSEMLDITLNDLSAKVGDDDGSKLEIARRSARRIHYLAEFALMANKSFEGGIRVKSMKFDIGQSLQTLVEELAVVFPDVCERVLLTDHIGKIVEADPVLIEFALSNILENALKYGDGAIEITINCEVGDSHSTRIEIVNFSSLGSKVLNNDFNRISWGIGTRLILEIARAHGGSFSFISEGCLQSESSVKGCFTNIGSIDVAGSERIINRSLIILPGIDSCKVNLQK